MNKTFGLELFSELKQAFGEVLSEIFKAMICVALLFLGGLLTFQYSELYSKAIELLVFAVLFFVICKISKNHTETMVKNYLSSLTFDEKDLLIYIYNHSKKVANAVYIPYDNAIAINLKYKRILRRYDTTPIRIARQRNTVNSKYCFMYGIRNLPRNFIEDGKIETANFPSKKLCDYLDKYQ